MALKNFMRLFADMIKNVYVSNLNLFVAESNIIEGINDISADKVHLNALSDFLLLEKITIPALVVFVNQIQPGAYLRQNPGDSVMIGGYVCPPPSRVEGLLFNLLADINEKLISAYEAHCRYEMIHPFMDGNGRSGRAIWLWIWVNQLKRAAPASFLHMFYYESLQDYRQTRREQLAGYWKNVGANRVN